MLKIGVLGAGHLGEIHMKCIRELPEMYELSGFYDINVQQAKKTTEHLGVMCFHSMDALIHAVDVVDVVTPTTTHYDCASAAIRKFKHTFIEKPVTTTIDEAQSLIKLAREADVHVQVGHVERFNPAFRTAQPFIHQPRFIETHRLAQFNPRGTDVSVILDLMIHDIDIVLAVTKANVRRISASGVAVLSDTPDIANARLELDNGCVANLTASRISLKSMRKSRFFQRDAYITVDFLEKESEIVRMREVIGEADPFSITIDLGEKGVKEILFDRPTITANNAIRDELLAFGKSILEKKPVEVSLEEGTRALDIALQILDKLNQSVILQED